MKFRVTPELAKLLKTFRVQSGVSAKDLAAHLGKSRSSVSKLESGEIRSIERDQLVDMLSFIAHSDDFYGQALPSAVKLLQSTMDAGRMVDQVWLMQFDVIERTVDVPGAMAADIARNLGGMGVSVGQLVEFANANIDSQMPRTVPANEVVTLGNGGPNRLIARIDLVKEEVEGVVGGTRPQTTYFKLYAIVHAMCRLQRHPNEATKLPPEGAAAVLRCAADYMGRWGIHSLIGFSHFLSSDEFIEYQAPLAPPSKDAVERTAALLREVVAHDPLHAIGQLDVLCETLEWDPAFALKVMGMPFSNLGAMSFSNKRRLLGEMAALVERYERMDGFERKIESY